MAYEGRTEKATPKKRKTNEKGNIFQSREVVTVFTLAAIALLLKPLPPLFRLYKQTVHYYFGRAPETAC